MKETVELKSPTATRSNGVLRVPWLHPLWVVPLFVLWGLYGLSDFPGFHHDDADILSPALNLLYHGRLAVPSYGPGRGHETAYMYQTPLHPLALALVFKLTGPTLWAGRLFSLLLAALALVQVCYALAPFGRLPQFVAIAFLALDPRFSLNARLIRYDWLAMNGAIFAFCALVRWDRVSGTLEKYSWLFAGGLSLGLAVGSHALYMILFPVLLTVIVLLPATRASRRHTGYIQPLHLQPGGQ